MRTFCLFICTWLAVSGGFCQSAKEFLDHGREKIKLYNYGDAMSDFSKAIYIDNQNEDALFLRGTLKIMIDDCPGGLTDLNKALEIRSSEGSKAGTTKNENKVITNNSCIYCHLGYAKARLDDPFAAISYYDKAIEANPRRGESYYRRGLTKLLAGKREDACIDLDKAKDLGYRQANEALKSYCIQ